MITSLLANSSLAREIVAAQSQRHGYAADFRAYLQRKLREVKAT
jgi:hypothetical protein